MRRAAYAEGRALSDLVLRDLLSAEKVGLPLSPALAGGETYPDWRGMRISRNTSLFLAAAKASDEGRRTRPMAARFFLQLGEGPLGLRKILAAIAGMAIEADQPYVALTLAKAAADKGDDLALGLFPARGVRPSGTCRCAPS
jgi:soluble lytic murein transglycosylase